MFKRHIAGPVIAALATLALAAPAHAQDAAAGAKQFKSQCAVCHSTVEGKNGIGPSLFGVVGRVSGQVEKYHYSEANKKGHLTWDAATLDKYLVSPRTVVPGTKMTYAGLKDDTKRADLIAYLATLK